MNSAESKGKTSDKDQILFWGGENEDKQDYSMDWDHEGQFWIGLPTDQVKEVISPIRKMLTEKLGGEWSQRPSIKASGRYMEVRYNHYVFADFTRKGYKERFVEIHPTETGKTIFVRFWKGLLQDGKAALERQGFQYQPQIPEEYRVKVPGLEISPEKEASLEKFRKSQPLVIPEGKLEAVRMKSNSWIGIVFVIILLAAVAFLLRSQLEQLFIKEEPLDLGTILATKSKMAVFQAPDGSIIYALAPDDIESKIKPENLLFGSLIDTTRAEFYAIDKIKNLGGLVIYQAAPEAVISIPDYLAGEDLDQYIKVDASKFRYDRKQDWEKYRDQKIALKGELAEEEDGLYLIAGNGYIKLSTANVFLLLNLEVALQKGKPVTIYGTVSATYDWQEVRKETKKMFRLNADAVSYETLIASP